MAKYTIPMIKERLASQPNPDEKLPLYDRKSPVSCAYLLVQTLKDSASSVPSARNAYLLYYTSL